MEPFKNLYNKTSITQMADEIQKYSRKFDKASFIKKSLNGISKLEMKERVVQISTQLHLHLTQNYKKDIKVLLKTLKKGDKGLEGFILWPYSYFIETYGVDDLETSMDALYHLTSRFTSEFGIRVFLEKYPKEVYQYLESHIQDTDEHIRRWLSEGTRPNLPWGKKVKSLDLKRNAKLLDKLVHDNSLYVRKSVANHMNDITRLDDKLALKHLKRWKKVKDDKVQWIVKHALRSLFKMGNPDALKLMGFDPQVKVKVSSLKLSKKSIKEGDAFDLTFKVKNQSSSKKDFMVDYIIHYVKSNGDLAPKVFKLKNITLNSKEETEIVKKVSFKKVTTRVHYKGKHFIEIQVNGKPHAKQGFQLTV